MTKNPLAVKISALVALVSVFVFSGLVFFQLQVAFGWTNPAQNPPGGSGALTAFTNAGVVRLGINTATPITGALVVTATPTGTPSIDVDPSGAATGKIIGLTPTPTTGDEAASKAYVDGLAFGAGGGKQTVTIYGVSSQPAHWANFSTSVNTFVTCLLGSGSGCPIAVNARGSGANYNALACPSIAGGASSDWVTIYKGFGPFAYMDRWYYYGGAGIRPEQRARDGGLIGDGENTPHSDVPMRTIGVSYSVCGHDPIMVAQTDFEIQGSGAGKGDVAGILNACVYQNGADVCNICKICQEP